MFLVLPYLTPQMSDLGVAGPDVGLVYGVYPVVVLIIAPLMGMM